MKILSFLVLFASMVSTQAALNGPCNGGLGACVHTSTCNAHGGTIHKNLCPHDPDDVKCCTDWQAPKCDARLGTCRFTDTCNTNVNVIEPNLCPGPNDYKCCIFRCNPTKRDGESVELDKRIPTCP
ncbi:hypothetical protein B0H13DRAFT_2054950 [Mycena leptocephala]|nr:hypothetical protein B0H13DRAFT_2216796 [Mycena leptocephala]KAJ7876600.1 hypothetical protein B0H13DRAFT_2054950 [Mycena leptocephala]